MKRGRDRIELRLQRLDRRAISQPPTDQPSPIHSSHEVAVATHQGLGGRGEPEVGEEGLNDPPTPHRRGGDAHDRYRVA